MILDLIASLADVLATGVPELKMIDFDRGQLRTPEDYESILQPGLLVGLPNVHWAELNGGSQTGDLSFYTKCVVRLAQHTHYYNNLPDFAATYAQLTDENINELLIEDAIHQQVITLPGVFRVSSSFSFAGTFFVAQHNYSGGMNYENKPKYQHLPNPAAITISTTLNSDNQC